MLNSSVSPCTGAFGSACSVTRIGALEVGVAEDLEAIALVLGEQRLDEAGDRVRTKVR